MAMPKGKDGFKRPYAYASGAGRHQDGSMSVQDIRELFILVGWLGELRPRRLPQAMCISESGHKEVPCP